MEAETLVGTSRKERGCTWRTLRPRPWRTCWAGLSSPIQWVFHQPPKGKDRPMEKDKLMLPVSMLRGAELATVTDPARPNGPMWMDLFLDSQGPPPAPVQTSRYRMTLEAFDQFFERVSQAKAHLVTENARKPRN